MAEGIQTYEEEEVSFTCQLIKSRGGSFSVKIKKSGDVDAFKTAIGEYLQFTFPLNKLRLWLATTTNSAEKTIWLPDNDDAADQLDDGVIHPHIQTLIGKKPLKPSLLIAELMEKDNLGDPLPGQIHVLAWAPLAIATPSEVAWTGSEARPHLVVGKDDQLLRLPWLCLHGTGIGRGSPNDIVLYRRAPVNKLWREIYRCAIQTYARLWVVGPPGSGKSCGALVFAYALNPSKWNVVWLHYTESGEQLECVRLMDNKKTTCTIDVAEMDSRLEQILDSASPSMGQKSMIFLDGVIPSRYERAKAVFICTSWHMTDVSNRRVVFVCSSMDASDIYRKEESFPIRSTCGAPHDQELSFKLLEDDESGDNNAVMEVHESQVISHRMDDQMLFSLESWRFKEYMEAVRHEEFFHTVETVFAPLNEQEKQVLLGHWSDGDRKEDGESADVQETKMRVLLIKKLIEENYFVAGGSARLMFDFTMEGAVHSIDQAMSKVPSLKQYLLELTGNGSPSAVDQILARYRDIDGTEEVRLVSSYVLRRFAEKLGPGLYPRFKEVCQVNPSIDNDCLESRFLSKLGHNGLLVWDNVAGLKEKQLRGNGEAIYVDPDDEIPRHSLTPTWFVPLKWKQGGYDAVFADPERQLVRFVHLAHADKLSYKPEPFVRLLNKLAAAGWFVSIEMVELCFVISMEMMDEFSLPVNSQDFENGVIHKASSSGVWTHANPDPAFAGCTGKVSVWGVNEMADISHAEGERPGRKRIKLS